MDGMKVIDTTPRDFAGYSSMSYECPKCKADLKAYQKFNFRKYQTKYCPNCGQKLDWEVEE